METQLLRDREIFPSDEALEHVLGGIYPVYELLMNTITQKKITISEVIS